jgi:hypothetical protein
LEKIQHREADFEPVDPEDMYIASKIPHQDFTIFKEIRTKEEPEGERLHINPISYNLSNNEGTSSGTVPKNW